MFYRVNYLSRMLKVLPIFPHISRRLITTGSQLFWHVPEYPELDLKYLCSTDHSDEINSNINARKGVGDISLVLKLQENLSNLTSLDHNYEKIRRQLYDELLKIPNRTHPSVAHLDEPQTVNTIGEKKTFDFKPREFYEICKRLNFVRSDQLGNVAGNRSYYLLGDMAELEKALINYTVSHLLDHHFELVSVPDILHRDIIEACGLNTRGDRTQVYSLDSEMFGPNLCLSGTSEMALAAMYANEVIPASHLPVKLAAVSRCYRAEASSVAEERGIYRVHQFTKVEMFVISKPEDSNSILEEFRLIEEGNFASLGLHLRTLDMPPNELGAPAYRKYDVEAWLPGRNMYGEVSSCSNCTDYQSRRLNIKYSDGDCVDYVHTLNGTACAIPRMLIAIIETFQTDKGVISIPEVLQKYMNNRTVIGKQTAIPDLKLIKYKK